MFLKIYFIWFVRRILPLMLLEVAVVALALKTFSSKVFVEKVLENAALNADSSYWEFFLYLVGAFLGTNILVQGVIIVLLALGALLLRDLAKISRTYLKTVWENRGETKNPQS